MSATPITVPFGARHTTVQVADHGDAETTVLLLHGGAGPASVDAFAEQLAIERGLRVLVPSHPGFAGTDRQPDVTTVRDLAALYASLLVELDLADVLVIGNSIGGWIAAELAAISPRVGRLVLVDAVGLAVAGHPVVDFFALDFAAIAPLSYAEPDRFRVDPTTLPAAAQAAMASSREALRDYAGVAMVDETLPQRLPGIRVPTLVVWGDHDRIVDAEVGRAYAEAIPGARFVLIEHTGHLPQLESPDAFLALLDEFTA